MKRKKEKVEKGELDTNKGVPTSQAWTGNAEGPFGSWRTRNNPAKRGRARKPLISTLTERMSMLNVPHDVNAPGTWKGEAERAGRNIALIFGVTVSDVGLGT